MGLETAKKLERTSQTVIRGPIALEESRPRL